MGFLVMNNEPQVMIVPAKVNQRRAEVGLESLDAYIDACNQLYYSSLNSKIWYLLGIFPIRHVVC